VLTTLGGASARAVLATYVGVFGAAAGALVRRRDVT
jgi:hypothetical protein